MSLKRITATNVNMDSDDNFREFIRIYNNAFPIKIEQEYVNLANLVLDYVTLCEKIKEGNRKIETSFGLVNNLTTVNEQVATIKAQIDELYMAMQSGMTSKQADDLMDIARTLRGVLKRKEMLDGKNNDKQEKRMTVEAETERLLAELRLVIAHMSEQLNTVYALNVGGTSRLDNLSFDTRHIDELVKIQVPGVDVKTLTGILIRYFNLRKTLFKIIEDFAAKAVVSYQKREILETGIESDIFQAVNCLRGMTIEDDYIGSSMNSSYAEFLNNGSILMRQVTDYFENGVIDAGSMKAIDEWLVSVQVDYDVKESYRIFAREMNRRLVPEEKTIA